MGKAIVVMEFTESTLDKRFRVSFVDSVSELNYASFSKKVFMFRDQFSMNRDEANKYAQDLKMSFDSNQAVESIQINWLKASPYP